jgi:tetratricopeptide (TPR) repeat protein
MGSKFRYLVIVLFLSFFNVVAKAQVVLDFQYVDSLTYKYYRSGDWTNLIKLGNEALDHNIDYKYLRQRMGLAFFSHGDYITARKHFEKALSFDSFDTFTLAYLYYTYLNTIHTEYAGYFAGKMPQDLRKSLSVESFQPVESIDFEYNLKFAGTNLRSNPQYYHFGINSRIGQRLGLYQMVSNFKQTITIQDTVLNGDVNDQQSEYFALLKFTVSPHWMLKTAYHFLNTTFSTTKSNANLGFLGLSANFSRFNFEINASVLKNEQYYVKQSGIQAGVSFSRNLNMYIISSLSLTNQQNINQLIYNQKAGFKLSKKFWFEGNVTFGDLTNYNDYDAMYVYNSIDPATFRTGCTLYIFAGKHITLWVNYCYERKEFYENSLYHYNQFSYLGGIKWKL